MNCEGCGKELPDAGSPRFCSKCGIEQLRGGKVATGKTSSSSAPQWMKGCLIAFAIMALLVTLFVAHALHLSNKKAKKEAQIKANMVEYLNKKYKKEFVVDKLTKEERRAWSWYEGRAYLKENREIAFWVRSSSENENLFSDTYSTGLWSYQGKQDLIKVLTSIYGSNYRLVSYSFSHNDDKDINYSYVQELDKCNKCVNIYMDFVILIDGYHIDKFAEAQNIYKLINKHIHQAKLNTFSIRVTYVNKSKFNEDFIKIYKTYKKTSDQNLLTSDLAIDYLAYQPEYIDGIETKIATIEDIVRSFKGRM